MKPIWKNVLVFEKTAENTLMNICLTVNILLAVCKYFSLNCL